MERGGCHKSLYEYCSVNYLRTPADGVLRRVELAGLVLQRVMRAGVDVSLLRFFADDMYICVWSVTMKQSLKIDPQILAFMLEFAPMGKPILCTKAMARLQCHSKTCWSHQWPISYIQY